MISRDEAAGLDDADPLSPWRRQFATPAGLVYLDGNSLGMAPRAALARLADVAGTEWAEGLIRSWDRWLDLPRQVGDRLAPIVGATPGSVVVHDSTTVNLYQLVHAALAVADDGGAGAIAVDGADFPTDRYVVAGIARSTARAVRPAVEDLDGVAVVVRSAVDYRTAARADIAAETARADAAGAVTVWDLSHAAGAVEVDLPAAGVRFAVGCTYKFLHGGPGAPAWSYVDPDIVGTLDQPLWGWFGQQAQFEMADAFEPHGDIRRLLLGTPGILALAAAEVGIGHVADATMPAIAAKGRALTALALDLCDELGLESPTPRDAAARGAHVAVRVADSDAVHAALTRRGVITDVRRPDIVRLGCAALTTRYVDVWDGVRALADALVAG
ncbi:MAG: kynureninase [Ilumatobacteraceae bacterium]